MIELFIWSIAAFGFCWVVADSKLSLGFRLWLAHPRRGVWPITLVECVACTGFWVGLAGQLTGIAPISTWWVAALYTCGANLLLAKWVGLLDEHE